MVKRTGREYFRNTQVGYTIKILDEADDKIIDLYDSYASGNQDLMDFVRDEIDKVIDKILTKKWYDDIGQRI